MLRTVEKRALCTETENYHVLFAQSIDLLPGTQHPQLWLTSCWRVNPKVEREVQDEVSSTRSPPFVFLLMYKHFCSGPQWVECGCALLICPQPGRTIQISVRLLVPVWLGKHQRWGSALLLAAVVLGVSLWRLINDVIQTRQIRALRRKIVKRGLLHPAGGQGNAGRAGP